MKPPQPPDLNALSPLASALASTIASLAGDVALVLDSQGIVRSVADGTTPSASACAGWVGRRWVDTATAETRPKLEKMLAEVRSGAVARRREVNHPAPEGESIPLAWSALRLGDSGAVIAVGRDLRAVAAIQQRFLDSQQELERAYWRRRQDESRDAQVHHVAHDALFMLDAASLRLVEANEPGLWLLGQGRGQALGRALPELLPGLVRAALGGLLAAARSSARAGEIRLRLADDDRPWDWAATPFRARQGQRLLLRARRDPPAGASSESVRAAVLIVDAAARVQTVNATALQDLGVDAEARWQGRPLAELVGPEASAWWLALVEQARVEGLVSRLPLDGELGEATVTAALLTEGEQELAGLMWVPHGSARRHGTTPTESLRRLAGRLGEAPLPQLLVLGSEDLERHLITTALWREAGVVAAAARLLAIPVEELERRMRRLELPTPGASS